MPDNPREIIINCDICGEKIITIPLNIVLNPNVTKIPVREYKKLVCSTCCFDIQEKAHQAGLEGKAIPRIKGLE